MDYIRIILESDMCVASGESGGNTIDSDICVDSCGLPYVPARRIKGCLREAAEQLRNMGFEKATTDNLILLFGNESGQEGILRIMNGNMEGSAGLNRYLRSLRSGKEGSVILRKAAHPVNIEGVFTSVFGQTRMKDGVKVNNTLRFTRVLSKYDPLIIDDDKVPKPIEFIAPIEFGILPETKKQTKEKLEEDLKEILTASCKALRHIGFNRNRGLGNVQAEYKQDTSDKCTPENDDISNKIEELETGHQIEIPYFISLDSPVSIPGIDCYETSIPGRSVIGCLAAKYLEKHSTGDEFSDLFLNGNVRWSPLTPVIDGIISNSTPLMLMELKNGGKRKINRYTERDGNWTSQKPRIMDGSYSVAKDNGFVIAEPLITTSYHHSIKQDKLYTQSSLGDGLIYGGTVRIPNGNKELARIVIELIRNASFRFGRSKGAQYSHCSFNGFGEPRSTQPELKECKNGSVIVVSLLSDTIIKENGIFSTDNDSVRRSIISHMNENYNSGLCEDKPMDCIDVCNYTTIGGYNTMWHLQKPRVPAVKAGSVYCFKSSGGRVPEFFTIGEYLQEGLGYCRVFMLEELSKKGDIKKGSIDLKTVCDDDSRISSLKSAMRVYMAKEALRRYAREYTVKEKDVPISRLRLMLSEAQSYDDLLNRVGSMSTSDISSLKEKGKRTITLDLLKDFYGESKKKSLEKVLSAEPGLYEEIENDEVALNMVNKMWKLPLDILLHHMHYHK